MKMREQKSSFRLELNNKRDKLNLEERFVSSAVCEISLDLPKL